MSLNSLTCPLQYEDLRPKTDPKIALDIDQIDQVADPEIGFEEIIGRSSGLRRVLQMVETVAWGASTVLLLGETGTGKELIARAIHRHSPRTDRPFVKLNCAAIPTGLLESELFGHERGSFTGAIAQKIGRLELAHQGSLFLDEIGDIPLELQPKLLRVLQEREFERLGSTRTQKVDVRIVAATHRDLEGMILEKQFRSDLYYRVNVFPIHVPPLRERPEDIPLLVRHFVQQAHTTNAQDDRYDSLRNSRGSDSVPVAWQHPGVGKRNRTRCDIEPRSCAAAFSPGLEIPDYTRSKPRSPSNSGRGRTEPYPEDTERDQLGPLRTRWCRGPPGIEPLDLVLPDEEAGYRSKCECELRIVGVHATHVQLAFTTRRKAIHTASPVPRSPSTQHLADNTAIHGFACDSRCRSAILGRVRLSHAFLKAHARLPVKPPLLTLRP